jgi:Pentapeptide repeats (8 copies)
VLVMLVGLLMVKWVPQWLAHEDLRGKDAAEDEGRVRTAVLAMLAGLLAGVGAYYTHRSFGLNRAGQITERFTRAIDQLGSPEIDVRLGGIYALERIARDSADDHPQVIEVLTAYVREHAPWHPARADGTLRAAGVEGLAVGLTAIEALERIARDSALNRNEARKDSGQGHAADDASESSDAPRPPTDVQATLSVLGRRDRSQDKPGFRLNLARTDLRGVVLNEGDEAHLEGVDLMQAHLEGADLTQAHLEGASLPEAHLEGADLSQAHLEEADLALAHLEGASLTQAHLEEAYLPEAHLEGAYLANAHLEGANFTKAYYDDRTFWPKDFDPTLAGARVASGS